LTLALMTKMKLSSSRRSRASDHRVHPTGSGRVKQILGTRFSAAQIEDSISENALDNVAARFTANPVRI
jgi:hypothetical protein